MRKVLSSSVEILIAEEPYRSLQFEVLSISNHYRPILIIGWALEPIKLSCNPTADILFIFWECS